MGHAAPAMSLRYAAHSLASYFAEDARGAGGKHPGGGPGGGGAGEGSSGRAEDRVEMPPILPPMPAGCPGRGLRRTPALARFISAPGYGLTALTADG